MARFVTPAGVVIEVSEKAGVAVGYKPVEEKPEPAKRGRTKKADESSTDEQ